MRPEISALFGELSDLPPEQRERYYAQHDVPAELRREVESLLSHDSGRQLGDVVQAAVGLFYREPVSDGDYCGPFQLLRVIGRGGMGVVYLAERVDGEVRQLVAVKLLRSYLDSAQARQRFRQERQILANLAHPNIARLIDAGHRADGLPYLVMEYIEGRPIDEHCRGLAVREKVALVATVCDAIASAHQKLIVHRDLKPGNILVDANGAPRVLDFGIAKLMDASDDTATVDRRLTPDYASPEQIAGEPATTATDIYSLGAVLYRLLTGEPPTREAAPPSRACAGADRDLDAIVLKTLRAEPVERYATAEKLGEDLRAWMDGRPVSARHGERWYRARRQLRRHWVVVTAGVVAASGLIGGLLVARAQRDLAQERFEEVRKLANEYFTVERDIEGLPGSTAVRERLVRISIRYLEGLAKRAGGDWRLKAEIAAGYRRAAEAQGMSGGSNLGRPAEARESLRKAADLLQEVRAAAPDDRTVLHDLIDLVALQARVEYTARNLKTMESKIDELQPLLARYEATVKDDPAELQFLGGIYEWMAISGRELSRMDLPMRFAKRSVELQRRAVEKDHSFLARGRLTNALSAYGGLRRATGDVVGALECFEASLAVLEQMAVENPHHYATQLNIANTQALIGRNLGDTNGPSLRRTDAAVRHLEESLRVGRRLMALDPNDDQIRFNQAISAWRLGDTLRRLDPKRSLAAYDEAIGILRPLAVKRFNRDVPLTAALSESVLPLQLLGHSAEAAIRVQEALEICESYRGVNRAVHETCTEYTTRAKAALAMAHGRPRDAVAALREWLALSGAGNQSQEAREDLYSAYMLAKRYHLLAEALRAAGEVEAAQGMEVQRRELVNWWKKKVTGKNDAELYLAP